MGIIERKEREKEARRNQILDATERIFSSKGIQQSTMDDIARDAELAKGTIYLYYKNKDELQVGLILRAFELMHDEFEEATAKVTLGIEKILALGAAYWDFAEKHSFHFALMCSADLPQRQQVSDELLNELNAQSNWVWKFMISMIDEAKSEGSIKPEIEGFTLGLLLHLTLMGVMKQYHRTTLSPGNIFSAKKEYNPVNANYRLLYNTASDIVMSPAITEMGRKYFPEPRFPTMEELNVSAGAAMDVVEDPLIPESITVLAHS